MLALQLVAAVLIAAKEAADRRMVDWLVGLVRQQILLADIGRVAAFAILGEKVVEGLVLRRPYLFGNRLIPFLGIGEDGIDVVDDAAEFEDPVAHHVTD